MSSCILSVDFVGSVILIHFLLCRLLLGPKMRSAVYVQEVQEVFKSSSHFIRVRDFYT